MITSKNTPTQYEVYDFLNSVTFGEVRDKEIRDFIFNAANRHQELLSTIHFMAQTTHQGNHTDQSGTFKECPRSVCQAAREALDTSESKP